MEEKDIIGSILPVINIEKINISNPSKEKILVEVKYSFYDSLNTQNTLWSSLPNTFKQCIKLVVAVVEDGQELKKDLLTFLDTQSSQNLRFFHSSFKNQIGSIDNFKRFLNKERKEDITLEVINGIEYRKYVSSISSEIDITNNNNLNLQALAYCYFDSVQFKASGVNKDTKIVVRPSNVSTSTSAIFFEPVDYYGKFTFVNIFTENAISPEKISYVNANTGEEFLGQVKSFNNSLVDFDNGILPLEEISIPVEFVEDMRNYRFVKKNLKNILNEVNALRFKFSNINNKLVKSTSEKQYVSQLFLSKKIKQEQEIPIFEEPILNKPTILQNFLASDVEQVGTFFFDYERFIKEKSILNRIKESTIFIDPNFLQFKIKIQKKTNFKFQQYDKQTIENFVVKPVSFETQYGKKNLLQVSFVIDKQIQRGNYFFSIEVFLNDNIVAQLLQNLKNLKLYLSSLETYSSIVFKNLDKLSNSVKSDNPQPTIYYDLLQNNFASVFVKAMTDIGFSLDEPIKSEDFSINEKNARRLLEEILISLKPENTNLETVYQFIELVNSIIKEYSKFTDIFSNATFNPHIDSFFNITKGRASVFYNHNFKEFLSFDPSEKLFILTKREILNDKFNSNMFLANEKIYFANSENFVNLVEDDALEEIVTKIDRNNAALYNNKFEKVLKELNTIQNFPSLVTQFNGVERLKQLDSQNLKNITKNVGFNSLVTEEKTRFIERTGLENYVLSLAENQYVHEEEIYKQSIYTQAKSREAGIINFIYNATKKVEYLTGFAVTIDPEYGSIINLGKPFWNASKTNNNLLFGKLVNVDVDKKLFKDFKYSFTISNYNVKFTNEYFTTD